jgi:hypothetical protein
MNKKLTEELKFCLKLWEKQGFCEFGGKTKCEQCAVPYLLWKLITGEILHKKQGRLTLNDWKRKINKFLLK